MAQKADDGAEVAQQPAPEQLVAELGEEARVGATPAAEAVNAALLALSRAARSFQLYQPHNATIRNFIEDFRVKAKRALDAASSIELEVRPFELLHKGEVVYREAERERSLAFRLFRDGVRRLRIAHDVRWEEMLRLLQVLSVRYAGVHQNEDDVVTLLRKAGFAHVDIDVIEGFVPEDDEAGQAEPGVAARVAACDMPADWDQPARELTAGGTLEWRAVADADLAALAAEESEEALTRNAVRAAKALLELRPSERRSAAELNEFVPFIAEVRDLLIAEGALGELLQLVHAFYDAMRSAPAVVAPILRAFVDRQVLRRLVVASAPVSLSPPAELIELLDLVPADHLAVTIDLLGEDVDEPARRIMRQLIERFAPERPDYLLSHLRDAPPRVACDLLRACARALPERALDAALELAGHPDASVVHEALRRFEKAPPNPRIARTLAELLGSPREDVRLRALDLLSRRSEHAAFGAVAEHAERQAAAGLSTREAELIGRTLARLSPEAGLSLFQDWQRPKGLVSRWGDKRARMLEWTLVSGLGLIELPEAERALVSLSERGAEDLRQHALATLARRRRGKDESDG